MSIKIKDILDVDIKSLNKEQLKAYTKEAIRKADNRRNLFMKRLKKEGIKTLPASYNFYTEKLPRYDENAEFTKMRNLLGRAKHYLSLKTSSNKVWLNVMKTFAKRIERISAIKISQNMYDKLWTIYNRIEQKYDINSLSGYDSNQVQKMIYDTMKNKSLLQSIYGNEKLNENEQIDLLTDYMNKQMDKKYEATKIIEEEEDKELDILGSFYERGNNYDNTKNKYGKGRNNR